METKIWKYIQKYQMIESGDHVVVGVSGGADSVCLLILLHKFLARIPFTIEVVHVNHGLRPEAREEAEYVKALCSQRNIPFHLLEADVRGIAKVRGVSEEEAGRMIRYEEFRKVCENWKKSHTGKVKIAVAHHQNDRAETMLFHLFRGTGISGLCGIKPVRGDVIRPLLCVQREEIENYLGQQQIFYCHDASNDKDDYSRNKIRHHILPYVEKEIVANTVEHMNRTAQLLEDAWEYIVLQTNEAYDRCVILEQKGISVNIHKLCKEAAFLQKYVLLEAIGYVAGSKKDITSKHIEAVLELLAKEGSHYFNLPYGVIAKKEYEILHFEKKCIKAAEELQEIAVSIPMTIELSDGRWLEFSFVEADMRNTKFPDGIPQKKYTKWFDYDKIVQSLVVRSRQSGDYLTINKELSQKSLKEYMIEEKIPKDIRHTIPILADGSHVVWVLGYRISENYKINKNTKHILQVELRGGQ